MGFFTGVAIGVAGGIAVISKWPELKRKAGAYLEVAQEQFGEAWQTGTKAAMERFEAFGDAVAEKEQRSAQANAANSGPASEKPSAPAGEEESEVVEAFGDALAEKQQRSARANATNSGPASEKPSTPSGEEESKADCG